MLRDSAKRFPHSVALRFYGAEVTFSELDDMVTRFAHGLYAIGVRQGDRVAIMLPNIPQAIIGHYGALRAGATVVQTNPLYLEQELETQLRDAGAETILALDLFYPRIQSLKHRTSLRRVITTSIRDFLPPVRRLLYPIKARLNGRWIRVKPAPSLYDFREMLKAKPDAVDQDGLLPVLSPDDLALLQYTGGTTGTPKGVMLSHRNVMTNAMQCRVWVPDLQEGREVFLGVIPFFHVYGLSTCQHLAIMTGSTLVLLPRFQVNEVLRAIQTYRVTIFSAIPMMFMKVSESSEAHKYNLRSLRVCLSGASPLHAEVQDRFERLTGVKISEGYGLTEAGPVTHCNPVYGRNPQCSIGVPFPDTETRIVDLETGECVLPVGQAGELTVRGPQIMQGYWNNEKETRDVLRNGWLYTGDVVREDTTGFFFLVDRKKDMIKSRGENVYPRDVEEVLFRHPAVKDAVVVGVPDRQLGEAVKGYVVLHDGCQITESDLITHCRGVLAAFKVPSHIAFRAELPRTLVGKVLRRALLNEEAGKNGDDAHTLKPTKQVTVGDAR
ncbi:MAG TPA: long-chain fatty acid--CoA ligase [Nitrospirales bacterium]|jgi:long-chain acyl-CoA synthetase